MATTPPVSTPLENVRVQAHSRVFLAATEMFSLNVFARPRPLSRPAPALASRGIPLTAALSARTCAPSGIATTSRYSDDLPAVRVRWYRHTGELRHRGDMAMVPPVSVSLILAHAHLTHLSNSSIHPKFAAAHICVCRLPPLFAVPTRGVPLCLHPGLAGT